MMKGMHGLKANHNALWYSALSIYHGRFSSYNLRKTPHSSPVRARHGVSFLSENLTAVLSLSLFKCVQCRIIYDRDISRVCSI